MKSRQQIWAENNPEKIRSYKVKYRKTEKARLKNIEDKRLYKLRHPDKVKQQQKNYRLNYKEKLNDYSKIIYKNPIIRKKRLVRSGTWNKYGGAIKCNLCGNINNIEHHHPDPYRIDSFIDLCGKCHERIHMKGEVIQYV